MSSDCFRGKERKPARDIQLIFFNFAWKKNKLDSQSSVTDTLKIWSQMLFWDWSTKNAVKVLSLTVSFFLWLAYLAPKREPWCNSPWKKKPNTTQYELFCLTHEVHAPDFAHSLFHDCNFFVSLWSDNWNVFFFSWRLTQFFLPKRSTVSIKYELSSLTAQSLRVFDVMGVGRVYFEWQLVKFSSYQTQYLTWIRFHSVRDLNQWNVLQWSPVNPDISGP